MLEIYTIYPIHDQICIEVNPTCLCQDDFWVKSQEEFSNRPVDRIDEMAATGLPDSYPQWPGTKKRRWLWEEKLYCRAYRDHPRLLKLTLSLPNPMTRLTPREHKERDKNNVQPLRSSKTEALLEDQLGGKGRLLSMSSWDSPANSHHLSSGRAWGRSTVI